LFPNEFESAKSGQNGITGSPQEERWRHTAFRNRKSINKQGGLSDEGLAPHFYPKTGATQLSLFAEAASYAVDTGAAENLEW
jgi:hypothetical protein